MNHIDMVTNLNVLSSSRKYPIDIYVDGESITTTNSMMCLIEGTENSDSAYISDGIPSCLIHWNVIQNR